MSQNQQQTNSSSSYSYSSTSYTSSSTSSSSYSSNTNNGGEPTTYTHSHQSRSSYNDRDGGVHESVTQETGKPTVIETTEIPGSNRFVGDGGRSETGQSQGRIEDVTDQQSEADRKYLEAMEDEYAKREGGA